MKNKEQEQVESKNHSPLKSLAIVGTQILLVSGLVLSQGCRTERHQVAEPPPVPVMPPRPIPQEVAPDMQVLPPPSHPSEVFEPAAEPPMAVGETYTVKKGDSLRAIAKRYGVSSKELMELNNIKDANKIRIGMKLQLPLGAKLTNGIATAHTAPVANHKAKPSNGGTTNKSATSTDGSTYIVQQGDVLSRIAGRFGVSTKALREANHLKSDKVYVGQKLTIPKASAGSSTAAAPTVNHSKKNGNGVGKDAKETKETKAPAAAPTAVSPSATAAESSAAEATNASSASSNAASAQSMVFTYTFSEGDTLSGISRTFGVLKEDLLRVNNIKDPNSIKPGQKLIIPISTP